MDKSFMLNYVVWNQCRTNQPKFINHHFIFNNSMINNTLTVISNSLHEFSYFPKFRYLCFLVVIKLLIIAHSSKTGIF